MDQQESIWIGPDKYIKWIEFDPSNEPKIEIDSRGPLYELYNIKDPLSQLWSKTETQCAVDCCGINAHRFWPEDIKKATQYLDKLTLLEQLNEVKKRLLDSNEQVVVYYRLNQLFEKSTFLALINYLLKEIERNLNLPN
ncbi:hypothetical protein GO755_37790 [Spirosoma sp. HMF4905]|uniref:Uncharacterized protein n=1 Tax=Spirosoma arboris TaxID=2682092 RepID=A0A7K1SQ13_9BACT|nr:DUF6331 family protein [Spirosoma arboris]MVM35830.1 hypothetical protein [Spirosoma arboris]